MAKKKSDAGLPKWAVPIWEKMGSPSIDDYESVHNGELLERRHGLRKDDLVEVLLDAGASLDFRTFAGGTVLSGAVENEDSDPSVVRLVLEKLKNSYSNKQFTSIVNNKRTSTTLKWKCINSVAKMMYRTGASKGGLMKFLAIESGTSALNLAVMKGDVEIVKILLESGACLLYTSPSPRD